MPGLGLSWEQKTPPIFSMNIFIPEDCKKIHLLFSGGVDSTALLYLLYKQQKIHQLPIKCYIFRDVFLQKCMPIFSWFKTNLNIDVDYQRFTKDSTPLLRDAVKTILLFEPGYVYSGCNKVLTTEIPKPINYIPGDTPPIRGDAANEYHLRPFINYTKDVILDIFYANHIQSLLDLTYSCGFSFKSPCGACYFCLEKDWAIQRLKIL